MAGPHWLVCHTRPRCEKKFAALLESEALEHYLPLVVTTRNYDGRVKKSAKPLFPGYVFARVPLDRKPRIYQQDLLARAIPVTHEAAFMRQLQDVKAILASGLELAVLPFLAPGRRVKIVGGPLHGLEGVVDDPAHPRGVVLAIDVLQRGLLVKVPPDQLRPLH